MPVREKSSTTRLPQTLKEELQGVSGNDHPRTRYPSKSKISRKEARKEQRQNRKKNKAEYFSTGNSYNKRRAEQEEHVESPQRKRAKLDVVPKPVAKSTRENKALQVTKKKLIEKVVPKPVAPRIPDADDAYIAYLETKLGYSKGSKRKKVSDDDGLDDLLDFADTLVDIQDEDEAAHLDGDIDNELVYELDEDVDDEDLESQSSGSMDSEYGEDEWHGLDDAEGDEEDKRVSHSPEPSSAVPENTTRYVPPHLRNKENKNEKPSEAMVKLSRQLKGLLNRMSEQNMGSILDSIEGIYRDNRRNDVTTSLTTLIIDGISSHSSLLDSYVVLYAAFVSSLHKVIGIEFAAYFVQNVVSSYERYFTALQTATGEEEDGGKECSNLIVLVSELYNFQVISSVLVFDIIRGLLDAGLSEFVVELLLKIVRNSGQQLRQDDPSALKDIIQIVQSKVSDTEDALSSRTRFMIETLTNLKNNKSKRNVTQNQGADSVERMKKFLAGLSKKRTVLAHEPLRVSLEDLHNSETKGKWWLVGAAWGGDPLVDRQAEIKASKVVEAADSAGDLVKLARKQGMNSDIRRSVFVVLMSSEDYVDACERLSQLNLTEFQQREIVRVLLHCCGNEKTYNPYYTLVCQQLCRTSHSYKITLQFSLWDFLRDLGETSVGGTELIKNLKDDDEFDCKTKSISPTRMRNVARAYGWWIAKDCVALSILKPVDFTSLKKTTTDFLREMMLQIFICSQRTTPSITSNPKDVPATRNRGAIEEIFIKATRIQTLAMGLVYFLSETFRDSSKDGDEMGNFVKWAGGLAKDTLRAGVDIVPTL